MNNSDDRPIYRWTERAVPIALMLFMCAHTLPKAWKSLITDFPNYYLSARLAHEGYDTSRMYEWKWFEREKDHRDVDVRVIGLIPVTPFSTLFMWPITGATPLTAKRIWIVFNLMLVIPIGWMLRSMTDLSYRRIALAFALCFPFYRNLEFGQFYVVLLSLIVAACWAYLGGQEAIAGSLVAIAAACKVFPVLLFIFFLQRRSWRALTWGAVTGAAALGLSVLAFGWNVHRTYLEEILPWALRGEAMPPYEASSSISGLLHILFLFEPQWNQHPWHPSVLCYALLLPALQMLVLAPAILMIDRKDHAPERVMLEWSALLTASLAISTNPALYNFVLMVLPMCVLTALLIRRSQYGLVAILLITYIGTGLPVPATPGRMGLATLLHASRLPLILCILTLIYWLLWKDRGARGFVRDWSRLAWSVVIVLAVAFSTQSTFFRERAEQQEYAFRLPLKPQGYLNATPQTVGAGVGYVVFTLDGYLLIPMDPGAEPRDDDLSFQGGSEQLWVERARDSRSTIVNLENTSGIRIDDARDPMISTDGRSLAFVRDDHGQGRLMVRNTQASMNATDVALTPTGLNVYEASFLSDTVYAFSATADGGTPQVYVTDATHKNVPLALGESRYPALSFDGRWLAYSRFEHGAWNLSVRDQRTGMTRPIGNVPCNQIEPSWDLDSKSLLYGTDCGRSLWFTSIARRKVIP